MSNFENVDRRQVLRLFAGAACGAAALPFVAGCTPDSSKTQVPAFEPVDLAKLANASNAIAKTLMSFLSSGTSNEEAMSETAAMLFELGIQESALYGALDSNLDNFGHMIMLNAGTNGFLLVNVHNDSKYVEPLILRHGIDTVDFNATAAGCKMTKVCTNTIDLGGGSPSHDFSDTAVEDPGTGLIPGFNWERVSMFEQSEIALLASVIDKSAQILADPKESSEEQIRNWVNEQPGQDVDSTIDFGITEADGVTWFDWLLRFGNGSSALVQVATGEISPVYAFKDEKVDPRNVVISFDMVQTNESGQVIAFPHVSMTRD